MLQADITDVPTATTTTSARPAQTLKHERVHALIQHYWPILVLVSVAAVIFFVRLGQNSLEAFDEAIYAQVSKEMVRGGNWLVPHYEYKPWFHKPPLFMWVTGALFGVFGVDEFWSRAASAASGIGVVVIIYLIGKLLYDSYTGLLAGLILLTNYQFVHWSRFGTTDVMLSLFVFLAIYAYLRLAGGIRSGGIWCGERARSR